MLAYCGLNCETCPIHLATLEPDPTRQKTMREEIVRVCATQYGMNLRLQDVTDCDGCRSQTGRLFSGCKKCEVRTCAAGRELTSCAFCTDYVCEKLLKHFESDPAARERIEAIRNAR